MSSLDRRLAQVGDHHLQMTALDVPDLLGGVDEGQFQGKQPVAR